LSRKSYAHWILEGDIKGCFDHINHDWLLQNIPLNKKVLAQWLKAGVVEQGQLRPTTAGTPQGGIISPLLANMALDGLEPLLRQTFPKAAKVHLVRYADDFIITGQSQQLLEQQVKPLVEQFLATRGLTLSPHKTTISHINDGFDFLGFNLRKYNDKLLIKPSKQSLKRFLGQVRSIIKAHHGQSAGRLITQLNPLLTGWGHYYRHVCSKRIFRSLDHHIFKALWRWAKRRHSGKHPLWIKEKYFQDTPPRRWVFSGYISNHQGQSLKRHLHRLDTIPIKRHIKVKASANPFDPAWELYFEKRADRQMAQSLAGRSRLTTLWHRQQGRCPHCHQKITTDSGWHVHHIVWRSHGGSDRLDNLLLLHPACHYQLHSKQFSVSKPRPHRGVSMA
jgi:RNA-directed DNA polymerase